MKRDINLRIRIIFSALLGAALIVGVIWFSDPASLIAQISQANPVPLIAFAFAWIAFYILRAIRWKVLLHPVKKTVGIRNTFWSTNIGYMVNTIIPLRLGGEFARVYALDGKEKIGFSKTVSSVVVERILDLLAISSIGLSGALLLPLQTNLPELSVLGQKLDARIIFILIGVAMIGIVVLVMIGTRREKKTLSIISSIIGIIPAIPKSPRDKSNKFSKDLIVGAKGISHSTSTFTLSLVLSIIIWLTQIIATVCVFQAFGMETPMSVLLLGSMIVQLSFILPAPPGFVGTYETYWTLAFLALGISGLDTLLAAGIVSHIISVVLTLSLGSIGISYMGTGIGTVLKFRDRQTSQNTN